MEIFPEGHRPVGYISIKVRTQAGVYPTYTPIGHGSHALNFGEVHMAYIASFPGSFPLCIFTRAQ